MRGLIITVSLETRKTVKTPQNPRLFGKDSYSPSAVFSYQDNTDRTAIFQISLCIIRFCQGRIYIVFMICNYTMNIYQKATMNIYQKKARRKKGGREGGRRKGESQEEEDIKGNKKEKGTRN